MASVAPLGAPGKPVAAATVAAITPLKPPAAAAPSLAPPERPAIDAAATGYETYTARHEDTLLDLAVKHGLGFIELAMANPDVDPWLPGEGTTIILPKMHLPPDAPREGIVLNLPEQRMFYYSKGKLVRSYPIGIGRDGHSTPLGTTTIVRKAANPTWYPTASARADDPTLPAVVPPGPDNPLGNRALYLGWTSYLIHGTNKEYGIGRRASRGCIRMYPNDIAALFDKTPVGTKVTVVDQPVKVGWIGEDLYVEASPTIDQVREWEDKGKFAPVESSAAKQRVLQVAGAAASRIDWAVFDRAVSERRGLPTRITQPSAPALATASPVPAPLAPAPLAPSPAGAGRSVVSTATAARPQVPAPATSRPGAAAVPSRPGAAAVSGGPSDSESEDLVQWLRSRLGGELPR
jgi:L,D-transpeptidase ErfK/SrfK